MATSHSTMPAMHWWTTTEKSLLATTLGIIIVFGVCGNLLVIIAILRFKRLRRAVNSYLILNLAISDFLTASMLMPYHLATVLDLSIIADDGLLCKVGGILSYPFYICSTLTLVMLAIERHIAVSDPLRYMSRVTARTVAIMIVFSWFQGVIFVVLFSSLANIEFSTRSLDCGVAWEGTPLWLSILALLMNIVLPFFLLLIMSLRVLIVAIRQKRRIDIERFSVDRRRRRKKSVFSGLEGKATVAVLVVIFVFLILWIPFLLTRGLMAFTQMYTPPIVNTAAVWIVHLNSVVNVFIYTVRRSDYRQAFVSVIRCISLSRSRDIERTAATIKSDNELSTRDARVDRTPVIRLNDSATTIPDVG